VNGGFVLKFPTVVGKFLLLCCCDDDWIRLLFPINLGEVMVRFLSDQQVGIL